VRQKLFNYIKHKLTMDNQHKQDDQKEMHEHQQEESLDTAGSEEQQDKSSDPVQDLENRLAECNDKYLRLAAEFDNFRKRSMKDRLELINTASEDIIKSLLEVLDDVDRAENQMEQSQDISQIKEGISLVFSKFKSILQQKGLKEMETAGKEFDVEQHEAIAEIPAANESDSGKIVDVISKGYLLHEKIIRHAKVVVGK